jgi:hypothetical protein
VEPENIMVKVGIQQYWKKWVESNFITLTSYQLIQQGKKRNG